jgi:hypothetical protein
MVYTLAERKLRHPLEHQNQTLRDQRKQPTAKPTFRWIMQKFQGIHMMGTVSLMSSFAKGKAFEFSAFGFLC